MVECEFYTPAKKDEWDRFVSDSKTPLFIFQRSFMEYHADRFVDASLMIYEDKVLVAVLPASRSEKVLVSHGGLTYGGLVLSQKVKAETVLECVQSLKLFAKDNGFNKIVYKAIPYIFSLHGAQEDLYSLFRVGAEIVRRDLSSIIYLDHRLKLSKGRKWLIARAKKNNLIVTDSQDWDGFIGLLHDVLAKHGAAPVHTSRELELLASLFPDNISLRVVVSEEKILAATLLFKFGEVVHTQYLATSAEGKEVGALDHLIEKCIQESADEGFKYFSFGVSTEDGGKYINSGLLAQKESFGARAMIIDFYEILLND
ncbi:GNAT family N-acetyltransferase [Pseudomonas sp. SZMC_28357]|uniref:GNAT family N-acetyltransferase n=1 Tax=Pseudomonas sp. SZMC_28357 TaxID=3074380 RepID=UPI002871CE84|nr:GNAT family N-acetyltransferase [Pseudomonas sp. SZMC_28357]MDR9753882.1 GNAT family N-acetyltransferase [Pseudomonas sp. SZMC_28357]